ncbi:MAG TPA: YoaK family protein [Acidimicrobiales bacterium]
MALVHTFMTEIKETVFPGRDSAFGPLPPLLLALTVVTGLVDSFSYLVLGHVFVANMTGNVVFLAFALVGARGFSIPASIAALCSFGLGAVIGGRVCATLARHRARLLSACTTIQALFVAVSVALAAVSGTPVGTGSRYGLIAVLGISMGIQNAAARKLAVPDLTTTVLTMTITGITADSPIAGRSGARAGRRGLTVVAMFLGAVVGALCIVHAQIVVPLAIALVVAAAVGGVTRALGASDPAWSQVDR